MAKNKKMYGGYASMDTILSTGLHRVCRFCGKLKPITDYHKNGKDENGDAVYRLDCKTCYNIRRKENNNKKVHSDFLSSQKRRGEETPEYSHQEWKEAVIYFGGTCAYCGASPRKNQKLTKDHLEPLSKGGRTIQSNIIPVCKSCNSSKGAEEFKSWYMKQSFFSQDRLNRIFNWRTIMRQVEGGF